MRSSPVASALLLACAMAPRPAPFETALHHGEREERRGRLPEAAEAYAQAAASCGERAPDCALARYRRAKVLERSGSREEAVGEYLAAVAAHPEGPWVGQCWLYAARLQDALGRREEATAMLERIVFERSFEGLAAKALDELLDRRPVEERLSWLDSVEPRLRETELGDNVLWEMAHLEADAGRSAAERRVLERLVRRYPFPRGELWDEAVWRLADLAESEGDAEASIGWLERLLAVRESSWGIGSYDRPRMDDAALRIARLHLEVRGDPSAAATAAASLRDRFEDSDLRDDSYFLEARARVGMGDLGAACDLVESLREESPGSRFLRSDGLSEAGVRCEGE